jgi:hypothetical protein
MSTVRWVAGAVLLAIALTFCACNVALICRSRLRHQHHSLIPLIGGLLGMTGFLALPVNALHRWFWLPAVADVGTVVALFAFGLFVAKKVFGL